MSIASAMRSKVSSVGIRSPRSTKDIMECERPDFSASSVMDIPIFSRLLRSKEMSSEWMRPCAEGFGIQAPYVQNDLTRDFTIVKSAAL